jgi:hypothetical protein
MGTAIPRQGIPAVGMLGTTGSAEWCCRPQTDSQAAPFSCFLSPVTNARIRRAAMTWAQRLKQVFGIDIETCPACDGTVRIIACIEDPDVIEKILAHPDAKAAEPEATRSPPPEAIPAGIVRRDGVTPR